MLAGTISDHHGPLFRGDDQFNGNGDESAQAMARSHVYRILTDRSFHQLQLHLERCQYVIGDLGRRYLSGELTDEEIDELEAALLG